MVTVAELISGLESEMVRLGYKDSTLRWYRGCWRRVERFFAARGVEEFSLDIAMAWVDEACDFFAKEQAERLKPTDVYLFRVAQMLADYHLHGAILRRYSRSLSDTRRGPNADMLDGFTAWLQAAEYATSTVRAYTTIATEFMAFVYTRGGLNTLDAQGIDAFVATLAGYQVKTVEHRLCGIRSFLRYASGQGLVADTLVDTIPKVKATKQAKVPSVWDPAEVTAILEAIDRGNPGGKRDYALILLITRLGLRGIDVKRLQFSDIDWPGNRISITQAKTGEPMWLPLLKDIGWALIDYLRHGRPVCDSPEVFIRHTAPLGPFSEEDHLHQILVKHARVARVGLGQKRRHGMHSLRHTLATRLMEEGTPIDHIAQILGHQSVASTGVYLKSSLQLLAHCALDPDTPLGAHDA